MCRPRVANSSTVTTAMPERGLPSPKAAVATTPHRPPLLPAPGRRPAARSGRRDRRVGEYGPAARSRTRMPNAREPIMTRCRRPAPRRRWPSTPGWPPPPAALATRRRHRYPRPGASPDRRSAPGEGAPTRSCARVRSIGARACHHALAPGARRSATRAAAVTTTPSSSTGVRRRAAWAKKPAIAARSAPPHTRSRPTGSAETSRARCSASRMAAVLRAHPASSTPVPRPTTATGSDAVSAAINVVAAVVFPIPMSPAINRSAPASISSSAIARPAATAATASSALSASSTAMLPLPRRTLWAPIAFDHGSSESTATSTTRTDAPATSASALIAAPPASKLATICAVTSGGKAETPAAVTP